MMPRLHMVVYLLAASSAVAQPVGDLPTAPQTPDAPVVTTLPQITLPPAAPSPQAPASAEALAAETPAAGLPSVPTQTAALPTNNFSYGNAPASLFFTPGQIRSMKKALNAFESIRPDDNVAGEVVFTEDLPIAPVKIEEPVTYPVYHLSSVVYHTPNDWTVWLNGARITPKMNDGDVKVVAVKPDRVWFSWEPAYIQPLIERLTQKTLAPIDPVKHRLTAVNTANFDRQDGTIRFSLKPNQSFAAGYFHTFEGKIAPPVIAAAPATPTPGEMTPQAADAITGLLGAAAPVDPDRAAMERIISSQPIVPPANPASGSFASPAPGATPVQPIPQPNTMTSTP